MTRVLDLAGAGPYDVVYVDCPWSYYGDPNKDQAAGKHYGLMTDEALRALPVQGLFKRDTVAFLWATSPRLDACVDLIRAWGLHYRGIAFNWVKTRKDGAIIHGQGVRPSVVKATSELVLAATVRSKGRPRPIADESVGQVICTEEDVALNRLERRLEREARRRPKQLDLFSTEAVFVPRGRHSEKPAEVRVRIERLYPGAKKIELFARVAFDGWDRWGNEAPDDPLAV
jgi:N6-adenosine-specific RNA methylase IME4